MPRHFPVVSVLALLVVGQSHAQDQKAIAEILARPILGPQQTVTELQQYVDAKIPRMPAVASAAEWQKAGANYRQRILDEVIFRGEAKAWRNAKTAVEWQETIAGGPGYRIRKLRYEAVPGLWIPALLYEPEKLEGKVPVGLAVNGHDGNGKAAPYKQVRCINMAKRGMIVLNVEWLGMGQLRGPGYRHYCMNQLDLCGSSGIAPFYLAMAHGLDVLLARPHADPERVAVSGLSGGGWQTIFISSLDTRVKLANPVAGYSSFRTRLKHFKDLGDSEQTPCDLATVADYTHLTAMLAPRPSLLTYNSKDNCCFESGYALPPLLDAATPIFKLLGADMSIRTHINDDPGTHNFDKDNRQAYYRMLGDYFFKGDAKFNADEIPCADEVKRADELIVKLPEKNADFNTLAKEMLAKLPKDAQLPFEGTRAAVWQTQRHDMLKNVLRMGKPFAAEASRPLVDPVTTKGGGKLQQWRLKLGGQWTIPVVELSPSKPKATVILIGDAGRAKLADQAAQLIADGKRVLAIDLFYFGECKMPSHDVLFALMLATIGDRALGLQANQLAAVARWAKSEFGDTPVILTAIGPRMSVVALATAALEGIAITKLELQGTLGSLKEIIEQNKAVNEMPELFCYGLLADFDIKQLTALVAPRQVTFVKPSERAKTELAGLKAWYQMLGSEFDPLAP